jgi:hypothetical protein
MLVILHISIALSSLIYNAYTFFYPSKPKFRVSYSLIALTIATGTVLVISTHSNMVQACTTGLVYTAISLAGIIAGHRRLAALEKN